MMDSIDSGIERDMLREFYASWRELHAIPKDRVHRLKLENAAQRLVDASHTLRNFYVLHEAENPVREVARLEVVRG